MDVAEPCDGAGEVCLTEQAALANLRAVLELCASGTLRCSVKTRRPTAAAVRVVAEHLADGDWYDDEDIAAYAWPLLVQAGGLAKLNGTRLELTAKGRAALKAPAHEVIRALWGRWITHGVIDELSRVENIKGQRSARTLTAVAGRRAAAAGSLGLLRQDAWSDIDDVFALMKGRIDAVQSGRALWRLYLGYDVEDGSFGYLDFYQWEFIEGRYLLVVLLEYAATLGLIDVRLELPAGARDDFRVNVGGYELDYLSRYDGLRAVRLTGLGAYAAGQTESYAPALADPVGLRVGADLVIRTDAAPSLADRLVIEAFAETAGSGRWQISRTSLLDAVDAGRSLDELTGFLAARGADVPASLDGLVEAVRHAVQQLTDLGPVRLVECADAALAQRLATHAKLRRMCQRVGTTHLAVDIDKVPAFRNVLRTEGVVLDARRPD